jgi:hypothetical protein
MSNQITAELESEIVIFEGWRQAAMELGLSGAALHLTQEISTRKEAILRLLQQTSAVKL